MRIGRSVCFPRIVGLLLISFAPITFLRAQDAKQNAPQNLTPATNADNIVGNINARSIPEQSEQERNALERDKWFRRGRLVHGKNSAELRRQAYLAKLKMRAQRAAQFTPGAANPSTVHGASLSTGSWAPLGPVPLASDATGNGTQDYHQVSGRATAIAIDPADSTGNTVYIGGAQAGIWKSTNAAYSTASSVTWTAISDDQATLSIGALAIQPGNTNVTQTVILAATGEADNTGDSYFGLGILRSADAGNSWTLIPTANAGVLSFSGLGGTRMAFDTASAQTSTVVAAMATSAEGMVDGAVTSSTTRGLYTSLDAGLTWTYDALVDPGGATDPTSATTVVYNNVAGEFFAAVRYHGFYSSPDGVNWSRLTNQPGGALLSTAACPPQSISNSYACPIFRAELTAIAGRNEMYAWFVYIAANGSTLDGGIWQSSDGGLSWTSISETGVTSCGDTLGCGVAQGAYDLALLAVPDGSATDLYAGAANLYKCGISSLNPSCAVSPFLNLTHVYGCDPIAAPAHVHPDQHAVAYAIPTSGSDAGGALMLFANDGGIYRALNAFTGLTTGSCSSTNQFDDLNQNLGSMTQFVSFSQDPTNPDILLGGAQGNGSPASSQATTNTSWQNVLGGDGGYNAIDPGATSNWYASNPDVPPGGLGVQFCTSGVNCLDSTFDFVVSSGTLGGDDGAFYFPYILDAQSSTAMLVGTCRVWRGPRTGGAFTALSPNFDTHSSGTCSGAEVNQITALAAGGSTDEYGSSAIYATTSGLGPLDGGLSGPTGGRVWFTPYATGGIPAFADVTDNGPDGNINPNQFPISGVAIDPTDPTGGTAYVTLMGFTGGPGHVWRTTNSGAAWTDFTGNLPDSPVNAVLVYLVAPDMSEVFVATDVGVFVSSTSLPPTWTELGPNPSGDPAGFLPNVAVTAISIFNYGGQQLLRASTYGRGIWQFNLVITPDFELSMPGAVQTVFLGQTATFNGTATEQDEYASSITLSCIAGSTPPPSTCLITPATLTPANKTPFTVTASDATSGDYIFNVQAVGSDTKTITHQISLTLQVVSFAMSTPLPATVTVAEGMTSAPVSFQITAAGSFNQSVAVTCNVAIANATCMLTPGNVVNPTLSTPVNMTASVMVPAGTAPGSYPVTLQATASGASGTLTTSFTLTVTTNPDFILSESLAFPDLNAGSAGGNAMISIASQDGFSGVVFLSCQTSSGSGSGSGTCSISPASVNSYPATATLTVSGAGFTAGSYSVSVIGTSGSIVHTLVVPFNVGDYSITGTQALAVTPSGQGTANLNLVASAFYSGSINATCDISALSGAMCVLSPANPIAVSRGGTSKLVVIINVPNDATPGTYNVSLATQDTTGAPSHSFAVTVTVGDDFVVTSSTPTQTVTAGQTSGPYNLTILPVGSSFGSPVTLACSAGLPTGAQCTFSPSTPQTPGTSAVDVVMSISTVASRAALHSPSSQATMLLPYVLWMLLPGIVIGWGAARTRHRTRTLHGLGSTTMLVLLTLILLSCGGVSTGGGGSTGNPVTYQVMVTGTSPGTPPDKGQSVPVSLVVNGGGSS